MSKLTSALLWWKVFSRQLTWKLHRNKSNTDIVVIVLASEAIGDNLVFLDVFHYIEEKNRLKGNQTVLVCSEKMLSFWIDNKHIQTTKITP